MKFNFGKIASVLASAVMLGSTLGIAAAATNYPSPFISGGRADVAVVVGASAAASDFLAAVDLGQNLQAELAKQTAAGGTGTGATATGGDSISLATSSTKLFYNSSINAARTTISKSELPTLLTDGKVTDDAGTTYTYSQSITVGGAAGSSAGRIIYSTSGADFDDPVLIIEAGTSAESNLYKYSLTFNKNINVSHADVKGNDLSIFGTSYTIASGSDGGAATPVLVLFGSGSTETFNEGETKTVKLGDKDYGVTLSAVTSGYAHISVDGSAEKKIAEDASSKIGDVEIYVKSVTYSAKETTQNKATLVVGSKKLKLTSGQTIKSGSDETSIQGTRAGISVSSGAISGVNVTIAMQKSTVDYIKSGGEYVDPVFGGLKISFAGVVPELDSDAREKIVVDTDNALNARATFTTYLSATEYTLNFNKDQDSSESTVTPRLADSANKSIHVIENSSVKVNELAVINAGDFGKIIKLTDDTGGGQLSATSKIQFEDAITGENVFGASGLTVGTAGQATTTINGEPYFFWLNPANNNTVHITWGAGSGYAGYGNALSVFPRIKLKNGEWLVIAGYPDYGLMGASASLTGAGISNNTIVSLPGAETLSTYEGGQTLGSFGIKNDSSAAGNTTRYVGAMIGNLNWTILYRGNRSDALQIIGVDTLNSGSVGSTGFCSFNATYGPAIIVQEEKKTTESGNSDNGDIICIASDLSGTTTPVEISVATPQASKIWSDLQTLSSDSYKRRAVTRYGSFIEYTSQDNDAVTIKYPNEQMYADVLFAAAGTTVSVGTAGTSTVTELGSVTVKDSEVNTVSGKNLIVLGGSCINTVAAKVLGSDSALCGAAFTDKTGVGSDQFLVQVVESPYTTGKIAMLVAGYEAADTTKAVTYLRTNKPVSDKDTKLKVSTTTLQTVA